MKRSLVFVIMLLMLAMSGCLVSSLHPFYKNRDKYFDPVMVGTWIDGDDCIWTIEQIEFRKYPTGVQTNDSTYRITYYEDEDHISVLKGTLFRLNNVTYVDFTPDEDADHFSSDMTSYHHIPVHTLARVQYNEDSILMYWYGDEWLNELFEENRIRLKHETVNAPDYDRHILTASTDELQKFIKKYANNHKTAPAIDEIFARGNVDNEDDYGLFLKLKPYSSE